MAGNAHLHSFSRVDIKTSLVSRNITVSGRRTSVRLEPEMWMALHEIARREQCSVHDICSLVGLRKATASSLTAAIRVFLMLYFRSAATEEGHKRAGHGNFEFMKRRARIPKRLVAGQGDAAHATSIPIAEAAEAAMPANANQA